MTLLKKLKPEYKKRLDALASPFPTIHFQLCAALDSTEDVMQLKVQDIVNFSDYVLEDIFQFNIYKTLTAFNNE